MTSEGPPNHELQSEADVHQASIQIDTKHPLGRIDADIYGHFLESAFFGNIEGGVFDEGSPLAIDEPGPLNGMRRDVLDLCRSLDMPLVRWPGGNFASAYRWQDGIGPRDSRPRRLELAWGDEESNRFGTDEFLAWCEAAGTAAYLNNSCLDLHEAVRWLEYTNYSGDTEMTRLRAAHGRRQPWAVHYWGIGNEVYGRWQFGQRDADEYAAALRQHARFMRQVDPSIALVGVGIPWDQEAWTRPVLERAGDLIDYLSLHLYGASTHLVTGDDYDAVVVQSVFVEQRIQAYASLIANLSAKLGLARAPALAIDEWNMRHVEPPSWAEPKPSPDGGVAERQLQPPRADELIARVNRYSPRTLADALFCAGVFNAFHRTAGLAAPVRMANTVNLVNANGVIAARSGGSVGAATYHVYDLYRHHAGSTALPVVVDGPARSMPIRQGDDRGPDGDLRTVPGTVGYLDVSATLAGDRSLRLAVVNRHRSEAVRARLIIDGASDGLPQWARAKVLGADAPALHAGNTLHAPDQVAVRDHGDVRLADAHVTFSPHSVTMLTIDIR